MNGWAQNGFPVFKLSEQTVDMLSCTKAPPVSELAGDDINNADEWNIPYSKFAVQLPYPAKLSLEAEELKFRVALVFPALIKRTKEQAEAEAMWSIITQSMQDVHKMQMSIGEDHGLHNTITNLCLYLSDGGQKTRWVTLWRSQD